jgi:predicted transglutaminase-like cysteine proteinase
MSFLRKISKRLSLYFKHIFGRFDYSVPFPEGTNLVSPPIGYVGFAKEFKDSIFCKKTQFRGVERSDIFSVSKTAAKTVRKLFKYKKETTEHWQSHFSSIILKKKFINDCDDFSLTCAEYLYWLGVDRKKINIVFCNTESGTGHLVCVIDSILIDNRFPFVLPWNEVDYEWVMSMNLNYPGTWRLLS